ncbi:TetR/AcrR family transcriptional regulator [Saccharothrix violaceirubra]|uniref:AcrR family transcriptional regulator n=1 Tax=Saccharothrix violaceirubra TaxID=413306 RepID=A0A7W7T417_9PSEU|nr:TetR/AcrR family transcriptional regulator [Saccharothrix violaceirubra]MBB4966173.1 AcrR family transcriptional regulator [Saccharothrix violaceirubra]
MADESRPGRPLRADARRNRGLLVEQAKIAFAEAGVDASLDEIARRAGVASGTLYRHFPTRLDLIEAVLAERIAGLVDLGGRLLTAEDAVDGLTAWLRAVVEHGLTYRGLAAAVLNSVTSDSGADRMSTWHAQLFETGGALLAKAREAGVVAADVRDADVLKLVGAIAWAAQDSPDRHAQADRLLALVLTGLRVRPEPIRPQQHRPR